MTDATPAMSDCERHWFRVRQGISLECTLGTRYGALKAKAMLVEGLEAPPTTSAIHLRARHGRVTAKDMNRIRGAMYFGRSQ